MQRRQGRQGIAAREQERIDAGGFQRGFLVPGAAGEEHLGGSGLRERAGGRLGQLGVDLVGGVRGSLAMASMPPAAR